MVDTELFGRYEAALGANATLFSRAVRDLADEVGGMNSAAMREYLGDRYPTLVRAYGTVAAEAARDFYEMQRIISGGTAELGEYEAVVSYPEWLDAESAKQVNTVSEGVEAAVSEAVRSFLDGRGTRSVMACADSTLDYNASRDPANPKWALVPHLGACGFCIMIGSRGFVYASEWTIGDQRHNRCKCTAVVDFDVDNPKLDGYDPDYYYRLWKRLENATVVHENLYDMSPSDVAKQREKINGRIRKAWKSYKDNGETVEAYRESVGALVKNASKSGTLSIEDKVDIKDKGHEVQLSSWFANAGHDVLIRRPRGKKDTNDALIDGEAWEFKRLTTKSTKKFNRRITEKIPRQGPNFIVDLSEGGLDLKTAKLLVVDLLEDDNIEKVILVKKGKATLLEK